MVSSHSLLELGVGEHAVTPALERLRPKNCQLEVILDYIVRSCSPK